MVDNVAGLPVLMVGFTLVYIGTSPIIVLGTDLTERPAGAAPQKFCGVG